MKTLHRLAWILALSPATLLLQCRHAETPGTAAANAISPADKTLNAGYRRTASRVLVREVDVPTLAHLDHAAYAADVMLWNPSQDTVRLPRALTAADLGFDGLIRDFKSSVGELPLSDSERAAPLHWKPALDYLLGDSFTLVRDLAEAYGRVTAAHFGYPGDVPAPLVEFTDLYLSHQDSSAWVKVELKPWVRPVPALMHDADHDGFPAIYAQIDPAKFTPQVYALLRRTYSTHVLSESEVIDYGHQLAAYWYPSRNTDFIDLRGGGSWPDPTVDADVKRELHGQTFPQPVFALRGKPQGLGVYFVLVIPGMGQDKPQAGAAAPMSVLSRSVSDNLGEYLASIRDHDSSLVAKFGHGSWDAWFHKLDPFHRQVSALLASQPASVEALRGRQGYLLFRRGMEYLLAGDLQKLPPEKNPLTAIVSLRDSLASLGIDFLFVPIPTKADVYPEIISAAAAKLPGATPQPYLRKLLWDLAQHKVETLDLLSKFQTAARQGGDSLYQRQDTHWTAAGLELAAATVGERVMGYSWFGEAYPTEVPYTDHDTVFSQLGDLYDRLPPQARTGLGPEKLRGRQVVDSTGHYYADAQNAPILVLGDSYTGVYEQTGCRHAGVTARLAKTIGGPVDLIMGWGGGPEAPRKLRLAGPDALKGKRLVIWMMSARDLFAYPGGWGAGS